jgi:putative YpdA family bacillithiol system oxidoreductase
LSSTLIIWLIFGGLVALIVVPYVVGSLRKERAVMAAQQQSLDYGLYRPASLHPVVDPNQCIGTGNCVEICPEKDVLGLISGQAQPVSPARCIGHGLCERSCPVDAIQLVFGTLRRGVDLPRIQENFETNVPGLYVVGELGGMGLIRNAFEQGRQCIEGLPAPGGDSDVLDVLIVGCGPAGLSCALEAARRGLSYVVLEKDGVGGTVLNYPRKKLVMTEPVQLTAGVRMDKRSFVKEELLDIWRQLVEEESLKVRENERVLAVDRTAAKTFTVRTNKGLYESRRVVLAIGRRGIPRKLGVPGEDGPNVHYSLQDAALFAGDHVLVVGGGDSAVEAAVSLSEQTGTHVTLSYRRDRFSRIKPDNSDRLQATVADGRITLALSSNVTRIGESSVDLSFEDGTTRSMENGYVFIFAGGSLPTPFLQECGIIIDTKFGSKAGG